MNSNSIAFFQVRVQKIVLFKFEFGKNDQVPASSNSSSKPCPKLTVAQCGFRPGRSAMDQIFALQQIFEKSWEYAKEVNACFVDLEKSM